MGMTSKYFSVTLPPKLPSGFPASRGFVCWSGRTSHFVRINWYFGLPENKATAGGKAALKLGW